MMGDRPIGVRTPRRLPLGWLAGAAAALLMALIAIWLWRGFVAARERQMDIAPRYARLAGLLQNEERVAQAGRALQADLASFVYSADGAAGDIGNAALQKVRDLATARGLTVSVSQTAPPREDKDLPHIDRIGLSLRVEGNWEQLTAFLGDLPRLRPLPFSERINIQAMGGNAPGQAPNTSTQLDLFVLKERKS